jgi:hypothetical protein
MFDWELNPIDSLLEDEKPEQQSGFSNSSSAEDLESIDKIMSEAERRFEIAQYYKMLLQNSLFQNKTEASLKVEAEVRDFIRERLSVLLGVQPPKTSVDNISSAFSDEQIQVLKDLADLGEEAPKVMAVVMGKVFKKLGKPPTKKQKEEPVLNVVKNTKTGKKMDEPKLKTQMPSEPKKVAIPSNIKIPKQYESDPTLKIEGSKVFVQAKSSDGQPLFEKVGEDIRPIMKDVTPVARSERSKPTPIPDGRHLEAVMQQQAQKVLSEVDKGNAQIVNQLIK